MGKLVFSKFLENGRTDFYETWYDERGQKYLQFEYNIDMEIK